MDLREALRALQLARSADERKDEAGSITRVPAPEIETLVLDGVRKHVIDW
jgi:hypothetical protein